MTPNLAFLNLSKYAKLSCWKPAIVLGESVPTTFSTTSLIMNFWSTLLFSFPTEQTFFLLSSFGSGDSVGAIWWLSTFSPRRRSGCSSPSVKTFSWSMGIIMGIIGGRAGRHLIQSRRLGSLSAIAGVSCFWTAEFYRHFLNKHSKEYLAKKVVDLNSDHFNFHSILPASKNDNLIFHAHTKESYSNLPISSIWGSRKDVWLKRITFQNKGVFRLIHETCRQVIPSKETSFGKDRRNWTKQPGHFCFFIPFCR